MRVIVADDSVLFREGIARVLAGSGLEVVGQAGSVEMLLQLVSDQQPDVVILDIRMPPTQTSEGLVAAARIRSEHPGVGLLLLSHHVETSHATELLAGGASGIGYLLKDRVVDLGEFLDAVRRVGAGGTAVDPEVIRMLMARKLSATTVDALTERERDVLRLMAEGRSNVSICQALGVSERTVEAHVRNIYQKLHLEVAEGEHRRVLAVLNYLQT